MLDFLKNILNLNVLSEKLSHEQIKTFESAVKGKFKNKSFSKKISLA